MASFLRGCTLTHTIALLCLFFFVVQSSWAARVSPNDAILLNSICSQKNVAPFYEYCLGVLRSDARTITSDIAGIGRIAIELAMKNATDTLILAYDLGRAASTDRPLQLYIEMCFSGYTTVISNLQIALNNLKAKSMVELGNRVLGAAMQARVCEDKFSEAPKRISPFTARNEKIERLCFIISAIGNLLEH